jgi:integrase
MLETYFVKPRTVDRIRASWIGAEVERYADWLADEGYATRCVLSRVLLLVAFGEFARRRGAQGASLDLAVPNGVSPPRLHDLRHSFAVGCLLRWYREGLDPSSRLHQLSTFMGHIAPSSTAVYLTTPRWPPASHPGGAHSRTDERQGRTCARVGDHAPPGSLSRPG